MVESFIESFFFSLEQIKSLMDLFTSHRNYIYLFISSINNNIFMSTLYRTDGKQLLMLHFIGTLTACFEIVKHSVLIDLKNPNPNNSFPTYYYYSKKIKYFICLGEYATFYIPLTNNRKQY